MTTAIFTVAAPVFVLAGFRDSHPSDTARAWLSILFAVVTLVVGATYAIVLEGRSGQTWGKRAVGLVVLGEDGSACGYGRAASRELLGRCLIGGFAWALVLPGLLSYLAALWDPKRQTWHDRIGETIVVRVERPDPGVLRETPVQEPEDGPSRPKGRRDGGGFDSSRDREQTDSVISALRSLDDAPMRASWWWTSGRGVVGR